MGHGKKQSFFQGQQGHGREIVIFQGQARIGGKTGYRYSTIVVVLTVAQSVNEQPNTIQQDIHPNILPAGNSLARYSAGIILLLIQQKIRHYGQN